ncbi:putative membrane protein [Bacteroides fragilis str. I1345]|nr:putative membrane protein [Bacteroides fragilis str. I1345]
MTVSNRKVWGYFPILFFENNGLSFLFFHAYLVFNGSY